MGMMQELATEAEARLNQKRADNLAWFNVLRGRLAASDTSQESEALVSVHISAMLFFYNRGQISVGIQLGEAAIEIATIRGLDLQLRRLFNIMSVLHKALGNNGRSVAFSQKSLELARRIGSLVGECRAWANLSSVMLAAGHFAEAIEYARRALAIASNLSDDVHDVRFQANQIIADSCLHLMHNVDERHTRLAEGLLTIRNAIREAGEPQTQFEASQLVHGLHTECQLLIEAGRLDEALSSAERAKSCAETSDNPYAHLRADIALAIVQGARGKVSEAKEKLSALELENAGRTDLTADILAGLAAVASRSGNEEEAGLARARLYQLWQLSHIDAVGSAFDAIKAQFPLLGSELLNAANRETIETFAVLGELHDDETGDHVFRVGAMSALIAKRLGMPNDMCTQIDFAARLHDIGKIAISPNIMQKPDKLDRSEIAEMQKHTVIGSDLLGRIDHPVMTMASQIARHHHEKYDGTGYPDRLIGDQIPLVARISAVADVFDALTHARCYKRAWSVSEAVAEMAQQRSVHFDPLILDAFMSQLKDLIAEHGEAGLDPVLSAHSRGNQLVAAREFLSTQIARQAH